MKTIQSKISKLTAGVVLFSLLACSSPHATDLPKDGFVPDAKTAIKIAVAVWGPIYGEEHISSEQPFTAVLTNGVWLVDGSLPKGWAGGTVHAEISKDDGRILKVVHSQ
jgi:hypothetical protein